MRDAAISTTSRPTTSMARQAKPTRITWLRCVEDTIGPRRSPAGDTTGDPTAPSSGTGPMVEPGLSRRSVPSHFTPTDLEPHSGSRSEVCRDRPWPWTARLRPLPSRRTPRVIFSSLAPPGRWSDDGYGQTAARMEVLAAEQPGISDSSRPATQTGWDQRVLLDRRGRRPSLEAGG